MRVLLATNAFWPADKEGGPPFSSYYLAKALTDLGDEVQVVTTDRNGPERLQVALDHWVDVDGFRVFYASTRRGAWIRSASYAPALHEAARSADIAVHSGIFWNYTGFSAWRECRQRELPFVSIPRGLLRPWARRHKGLKKALYWRLIARRIVSESAAVVALAEQEAEEIRSTGLRVPIHVVPNGAHVAALTDTSAETARKVAPYVLFLGRIHKTKGLGVLIPAFDEVARHHPTVRLAIAGPVDETYSEALTRLLASSVARARIDLLGTVVGARKAGLLLGATAFVLTSHSEGLPVAALEAIAAGVPCVLSDGCNLPEVAEERAGYVVPNRPSDVAAALARIVGDAALRGELARNARLLAERRFSWQVVGSSWRQLLLRYRRDSKDQDRPPEVERAAGSSSSPPGPL